MKHWIRPHTVVALLAAIAAALLVAMLPPLPDWSMKVPEGSVPSAVSSDARYVLTRLTSVKDGEAVVQVWDRERGLEEPILAAPVSHTESYTLFSPDERSVAIICYFVRQGVAHYDVCLFDLATGQKIKSWEVAARHILFSAEGKLLYVEDDAVRSLDDGRVVCALPKNIDGFVGEFASFGQRGEMFGNECEMRILSLRTGKEQAHLKLSGNSLKVRAISKDGLVVAAHGYAPGRGLWTEPDFDLLIDVSANIVQTSYDRPLGRFQALSPDGEFVVTSTPTHRPEWLKKWWPVKDFDQTLHVTRWKIGEEVAQFRNIQHGVFSPQPTQLALMREDGVIEGYRFPLRKPWSMIASAAVFTALAVWSIGWLWSRWRGRYLTKSRYASSLKPT